jgi:hypothetical protein
MEEKERIYQAGVAQEEKMKGGDLCFLYLHHFHETE